MVEEIGQIGSAPHVVDERPVLLEDRLPIAAVMTLVIEEIALLSHASVKIWRHSASRSIRILRATSILPAPAFGGSDVPTIRHAPLSRKSIFLPSAETTVTGVAPPAVPGGMRDRTGRRAWPCAPQYRILDHHAAFAAARRAREEHDAFGPGDETLERLGRHGQCDDSPLDGVDVERDGRSILRTRTRGRVIAAGTVRAVLDRLGLRLFAGTGLRLVFRARLFVAFVWERRRRIDIKDDRVRRSAGIRGSSSRCCGSPADRAG